MGPPFFITGGRRWQSHFLLTSNSFINSLTKSACTISYAFCELHGEQQSKYLDPANYNYTRRNQQGIHKLIQMLDKLANTNMDYEYLVYQRRVHKVYSEIPDTILHQKLAISKNGNQYIMGKKDLFGVVIAFRYLLSREDFLSFKRELARAIDKYLRQSQRMSEEQLLRAMGFPGNCVLRC